MITPVNDRSAGEQEFINQKTRELMVAVCDEYVRMNGITEHLIVEPSNMQEPYLGFAISKKWISADRKKILSAGWDTASRFLKR